MRSLTILGLQVVRPQLIMIAAFTTWVAAMLSNGPHWFTVPKLASPAAIGLAVLGASLFHFGAANPMYTRKSEVLSVGHLVRLGLILLGLASLIAAVYLTFVYLNRACQLIVLLDVIIVVAYAGILSKHWLAKNLLIAFVSISPILLGWFAGHQLHPSVPYGICTTFFVYLAREIVKDIQDRVVNNGFRLTLPLWLGVMPARRIAASIMVVGLVVLGFFGTTLRNYQWYAFLPYAVTAGFFLKVAWSLFFHNPGQEAEESKRIMIGSFWMVLTFFVLLF